MQQQNKFYRVYTMLDRKWCYRKKCENRENEEKNIWQPQLQWCAFTQAQYLLFFFINVIFKTLLLLSNVNEEESREREKKQTIKRKKFAKFWSIQIKQKKHTFWCAVSAVVVVVGEMFAYVIKNSHRNRYSNSRRRKEWQELEKNNSLFLLSEFIDPHCLLLWFYFIQLVSVCVCQSFIWRSYLASYNHLVCCSFFSLSWNFEFKNIHNDKKNSTWNFSAQFFSLF